MEPPNFTYTLSPARDAISWVEMDSDCRQKEWSKEVGKEQYLSYVASEVVLLPSGKKTNQILVTTREIYFLCLLSPTSMHECQSLSLHELPVGMFEVSQFFCRRAKRLTRF